MMMAYAQWIVAPLTLLWLAYIFIIFFVFCSVMGLPQLEILDRLFKYGKLSANKVYSDNMAMRAIKFIEVPKRYFSHFYIIASISCVVVAFEMYYCYFFNTDPPLLVMAALDFLASDSRTTLELSTAQLIAITLLCLQVYRRLHECLRVSVFSNTKMNVAHYFIGVTFYTMVATSLLAESPGWYRSGDGWRNNAVDSHWYSIVGIVLYCLAAFCQFRCAVTFSNLRKDKAGRIHTLAHKMPTGLMFDVVSCPHYLAEIAIYLSLNIVLAFRYKLFWMILIFVILNQTFAAIMCHRWYQKMFTNYPNKRKAIFPYLL